MSHVQRIDSRKMRFVRHRKVDCCRFHFPCEPDIIQWLSERKNVWVASNDRCTLGVFAVCAHPVRRFNFLPSNCANSAVKSASTVTRRPLNSFASAFCSYFIPIRRRDPISHQIFSSRESIMLYIRRRIFIFDRVFSDLFFSIRQCARRYCD